MQCKNLCLINIWLQLFMTSPCARPQCTASWCGTAWARKPPLRKAPNCVDPCGARWWSFWMRGRCSSPTPASYCIGDDECGVRGPEVFLQACSAHWEHSGVDGGGDMMGECDRKVTTESLLLPRHGRVYTLSKDSIRLWVHDGPPCHAGGFWVSGCCGA